MKKSSLLISVVVVAAGIYYFGPSLLDSAVKKIVNKYGSEVTGTEVNLEGFSLHPTTGEAAIRQITIANPQNYKMPYLFELNNISVKVDLKSLTSDTVISNFISGVSAVVEAVSFTRGVACVPSGLIPTAAI